MEVLNITMLKSLNSALVNPFIKVRIIKLWTLPSFRIKNSIHSYEMVLMDEEGTKIQASVMNSYLRKFEKFLIEKDCLIVGNPQVGDNVSQNPILQHPHRLFFNFETQVSKCLTFEGSFNGIQVTDFDVLLSNGISSDTTVDVVGYIYSYFPIEDHRTKKGKISKKMSLQIRNLEYRSIYVILWEAHAIRMNSYLQDQEEGHSSVILLQFGKYFYDDGKAYVHTQFNVSNLFINNDDIEEVLNLKNELMRIAPRESSSRQLVASQYQFKQSVFNTIEEVNKLSEIKSVMILGTIISFASAIEWYYPACKRCTKKLITEENDGKQVTVCPTETCKDRLVIWVPRFKIPLRVQDSTGVVNLTLFEKDANKLISKTAKELVDLIMDGDSSSMPTDKINEANLKMIPSEITELVGRKLAFKIDITSFNLENNYRTFTVKKCIDNPEIISKLQANFDSCISPDTSIIKSADFASEETVAKGSSSCSTQSYNGTEVFNAPALKVKSAESVGMLTDNAELKRKLIDVYDVDDPFVAESSTKKKQGPKDVSTTNLLVPKMEK